MIILSMMIIVILSFIILIISLKVHRAYLRDMHYYDQKIITIKENTMVFERAAEEILAVTQNFKAEKELRDTSCRKEPSRDCVLCDEECIFRRRDIDE